MVELTLGQRLRACILLTELRAGRVLVGSQPLATSKTTVSPGLVCYKVSCTLEGRNTNVYDASTAGTVWPRGADGHGSGAGRLRGALPQVRDRRSGAGDLRRSSASAVGAGAA